MTARREFPKAVQRDALARSGFRCEAVTPASPRCPIKVGDGSPVEYDHVLSDWMGGEPTLDNCAALCPRCHKIKTAQDAKDRARANGRRDAHDSIRDPHRRKIAQRPKQKAPPRKRASTPLSKALPPRINPLYVPGA